MTATAAGAALVTKMQTMARTRMRMLTTPGPLSLCPTTRQLKMTRMMSHSSRLVLACHVARVDRSSLWMTMTMMTTGVKMKSRKTKTFRPRRRGEGSQRPELLSSGLDPSVVKLIRRRPSPEEKRLLKSEVRRRPPRLLETRGQPCERDIVLKRRRGWSSCDAGERGRRT